MNPSYNTPPVCFIVFRRPEETYRVFQAIRRAKPKKLFIYGDGPRPKNSSDESKVYDVKKIFSRIDWDCEVSTHFSPINLGSKIRESTALNDFFNNVESGIILEDDCLPNESFFYFCSMMLEMHKDNFKIMHIAGTSLVSHLGLSPIAINDSYYYSNIMHGWGWATWKRAWSLYDMKMSGFPGKSFYLNLLNRFDDRGMANHYFKNLTRAYNNKIDCWDYQWMYAIWQNDGLCITPTKNLVSNIGFGPDGTYCTTDPNNLGNMKTFEFDRIIDPKSFIPNSSYDRLGFYKFTRKNPSFYINQYLNKLGGMMSSLAGNK